MTNDERWEEFKAGIDQEAKQWIKVEQVTSGHLTIALPTPRSVLHASPYIRIEGAAPMPNAWRRFWYWFLLGWVWRRP